MSAALSVTGSAHDLAQLGSQGRATLVISSHVVTEVERNLQREAQTRLPNLQRILEICPFEVVEPSTESVARERTTVEPKDAGNVAAAIAGNVQLLVTHDVKHLLKEATHIEARHGIVVCPPAVVIASLPAVE